ncbi:MAG TPA: cupin domain-containing protein [Thermoleophilaceae bacterium]|jgi:ethanolamine utilization protein EutQ|nr:cupin domain-containing protein [Thermoleophilaceae bacterium]
MKPLIVNPDQLPWQSLDGVPGMTIRQALGPDESNSLSAGFTRFKETSFDFRLEFDECLLVLEGELAVTVDGERLTARKGEVVWLPRHSDVLYEAEDECLVFFAVYPANWEELSTGR